MGSMRWIATTAVLGLLLGLPAAAQTPTVITLSCDGTMQEDTADTREQVTKLGLVINFAEQAIVGFGIAAHIDLLDASSIEFSGEGLLVGGGAKMGTWFAMAGFVGVRGIVS